MTTQSKGAMFEGLNPQQNARLNAFSREVYAGMESEQHGVLVGYGGGPYRHELPRDVAENDFMLLHLVEGFSSESGQVVAKIEYASGKPKYLAVTRRVGM